MRTGREMTAWGTTAPVEPDVIHITGTPVGGETAREALLRRLVPAGEERAYARGHILHLVDVVLTECDPESLASKKDFNRLGAELVLLEWEEENPNISVLRPEAIQGWAIEEALRQGSSKTGRS
jgi:hypothetical protein